MKDFFAPIASLIMMKFQDMETAGGSGQLFDAWVRDATSVGYEDAQQKGDLLEEVFDNHMNVKRGFEDRGELQAAFRRAAGYTDNWFTTPDTQFNVYYVCMSGAPGWRCCTVILTKDWARLHADPLAPKQKWYCKVCGAGYKTRFGMMLEMVFKGSAHYVKAHIPEKDWYDTKMMAVERRMSHVRTPMELYDALPVTKPLDRGAFLEPTTLDGGLQIQREDVQGTGRVQLGPDLQHDEAHVNGLGGLQPPAGRNGRARWSPHRRMLRRWARGRCWLAAPPPGGRDHTLLERSWPLGRVAAGQRIAVAVGCTSPLTTVQAIPSWRGLRSSRWRGVSHQSRGSWPARCRSCKVCRASHGCVSHTHQPRAA